MTARKVVGLTTVVAAAGVLTAACGAGTQPPSAAGPSTAVTTVAPTPSASYTAAAPPPRRSPLHVPAMSQLPELPNGCEATSLAMLLAAAHHPVSKLTLARLEPRDQ